MRATSVVMQLLHFSLNKEESLRRALNPRARLPESLRLTRRESRGR